MPLFGTFSSGSSRALGLRNGSPPLPPTITAPTDNTTLVGSGNTTNRINTTVTFSSTVTSFAINYFEYKLDRLNSNDTVHTAGTWQTATTGGNTSFTISNLLTSTKYGLYMRTIDMAGITSESTAQVRFTTAAEVAPTAPTPSLSATALSVTITYAAGTAGTYSIATREYSLHPTSGGTATYVPFTGTVTRTTRTDTGAALVPGTNYTVAFRYTASTSETVSTSSNTISTSAETAPGAPGASLTVTGSTTMTVSRGTSTAGTYSISYYEYRIYPGTSPTGTWISMPSTTAAVTGLSVDTTYSCQVRAVAATSGTSTTSTSVTAITNPPTPSAPSISFSGMDSNSSGTVYLTISKPAYAQRAFVNVIGVGTYEATDQGSYFSLSISGQPFNSTIQYKAYVRTRVFADGVTTADSSYGNTITWYTPSKGVAWSAEVQSTAIYFSTTSSCTSEFTYTFGSVPSSDSSPGYIAVTGLSVQGIQQTGTNLNGCGAAVTQTLANTSYLWWQSNSGHPDFTGGFGTSTTTGFSPNWPTGSFSTRSITFSQAWGGSSISGKYFSIGSNLGSRTGGCAVGCSTSTVGGVTSLNAYRMKSFVLTGYQTTSGSFA